ncbi:gluconate 2-dehydrogenase subunit 3 family protein [Natroniella sulfidigena]|uniref:gluconate 2-dehydrogenase subunit 3 family protein n=1 Tax=Natroniella sulfidigena TaxID=723921 RepID=UPI00200ABFAB|nr:gluconate 2-dehydrogenase subunit 3 family protein [Natroniella sulfidigena]MCK8817135.1 gluconate 2-dehydrogenase subunit 3 family protein [Natroniella sulfidigena]
MIERNTYYPDYDVLDQIEEWDPVTADAVLKRLGPFPALEFLTGDEEQRLRVICKHLVYDNRDDIFDWVIHFIDQTLADEKGEYQRSPDAPPEKILVREGLKAIDKLAQKLYGNDFLSIDVKEQFDILASLQVGKAASIPEWSTIPQKDLFDKLLVLTVAPYYSHPTIWSEIGYGGPAHPRGYYRIELGLADPWEAQRKDVTEKEEDNGE